MSELLKELDAKARDLRDQLSVVNKAIHDEKMRVVTEASGVTVGSVVVYQGKDHKVTKVDVRWGYNEKPWLEGNPRRKDGTFGTAHRNLYSDWELAGERETE